MRKQTDSPKASGAELPICHPLASAAERRVKGLRAFAQARLNAGLGSRLPNGGVSAAMKYRQDNDAMFLRTKINDVRETIGDDTPNVLANDGKLEMVFRCQRHATVNLGHELKSKTNPLWSHTTYLLR